MEVWGSKTDFLREVGGLAVEVGGSMQKSGGLGGSGEKFNKNCIETPGCELKAEISTPKVRALLPPPSDL